jgi:5-bromo-4-chloroindolyl phosphate hydrolysis protein
LDATYHQTKALQDKQQLKSIARDKARALSKEDFAKFAPQLQQARSKLSDYKKEMARLKKGSSSNDNSLKGQPLKERFVYGGNFQLPSLRPLSITAAPYLGYKLDKKFVSGVSVTYNAVLDKNTFVSDSAKGEYGYRLFTDYKFIKDWFVHAEFEQINKSTKLFNSDNTLTSWQTNGYIGIGKKINLIKGLKANMFFLCNLMHKDLKYFDKDAFQLRIGLGK